jgi:hypothetical protein
MARKPYSTLLKPLRDVLGPQAGADGAFFNDVHRRGQGAGAREQRDVGRFLRREVAGDLEIGAEFTLDGGHRDGLALALFVQHDGHGLAQVFTRDMVRMARPATSSRRTLTMGRWSLSMVALACLSWSPVAMTSRLRPTVRTGCRPGPRWGTVSAAAAPSGSTRRNCSVAGAADDVLGARRVLHTGQLHHHAVAALLLDDRLGHAQFIDALVQRVDVLLQRLRLDVGNGLGRQAAHQAHAFGGGLGGPDHCRRHAVGQQVLRRWWRWRHRAA